MILGCRLLAKATFNAYRIIVQQLRNTVHGKSRSPLCQTVLAFEESDFQMTRPFGPKLLVSINDRIFISSNIG